MTITPKKSSSHPASSSCDISSRPGGALMDEVDGLRVKISSEDSLSVSPTLAEPINLEDPHYARLRGELEFDAQNLEAESWSVAVDPSYQKALNKEAIKRQDVIYELMQTEMHHVRTLKILLCVYMHELRQYHLFEEARLEWLFPSVEALLTLHQHFLNCLKVRLGQSQEEGGPDSYQISQFGDILLTQFSDALGEKMMECYSVFCSRHSEAISFYKEQMQSNKKLQILMRKVGQLPLVRRLGIPECFLLVTQRITKYPALVERIIQNTEVETEEHRSLVQGLAQIKETISMVDAQVNEYEKAVRLREIILRLDPKSQGRLKHGQLFRREDLINRDTMLLHEGTVTWKTSGKQKDIQAVLLTDMLLLLQEKDQKFVFAAVDNKPSVISLQGLIVREVAHEDRAMFLISVGSSTLPEMYEIHMGSRDERVTWTAFIREAVESFPQEEMHRELMVKLQQCQDALRVRDDHIILNLTEKQQIFAILYENVTEQEAPHKGLLLRGEATDLQQGETLLKGAINEVETLQNLLFSRIKIPNLTVDESETQGENLEENDDDSIKGGDEEERSSEDRSGQETDFSEGLEQSADDDALSEPSCTLASGNLSEAEVCDSVIKLAQMLHSLQAIIVQQDTQIELQRAFQSNSQQPRRHYSNMLLEQEKQRNLEKQKEQLANLHKLQAQHREEQQRWEKETERQRIQMEAVEAQLQQREEDCRKWEEKLGGEKSELEHQWSSYQEDLERLRESTKSVERERDRLTQEKERLEQLQEKLKLKILQFSNPGHSNYDDPSHYQSLSTYPSFRGSIINGGGNQTVTLKPSSAHSTATSPMEVPPKVPPRRESINPQPPKAELPIHLISTTNQVHKPPVVQQQIPTKLATLSKGKEKGARSKSSHHRTHSAANIDVNQVVPIRVTVKEGGSMRAKRSGSPKKVYHPEPVRAAGSSHSVRTTQSFIVQKKTSSEVTPPAPPPFPKDVLEKEKVIFL